MDMKRILSALFLLFLVCNGNAQEYAIEDIKQNAINLLEYCSSSQRQRSIAPISRNVQSVQPIVRNERPYLYIVEMADSAGWAIMTNEQQYSTYIGYAESGTFSYEEMPPALGVLWEQHMDAIDSVRLYGPKAPTEEIKALAASEYETPILLGANAWGQSSNNSGGANCEKVYNKYAVKSTQNEYCGRHFVGCGAVAMGQILHYWHWPDYAIIRDTIISGVWHGDENIRCYDWDNMPDKIYDWSSVGQVDAIASLLRDCGYAAHTTYHNAGSVALFKDIHSAMEDIFHYHANREHEYAWTDIAPKLKSEIDLNRPVLCQAWKSITEAHSFVIDGYRTVNETLEFHINFGWCGQDNGYWNLDFDGWDGNRTFLTEIYPDCSARQENVYLATNETVKANKIFNFYTENDIYVCHNNNSITIESGGKMILRAGNSITLKSGFRANAGSKLEMSIRSSCTDNQKRFTPQRADNNRTSENGDEIEDTANGAMLADDQFVSSRTIDHYVVYDISGCMMFRSGGEKLDISALPKGFYAIQTIWEDGSVSIEKVMRY